MIYTTTTQHEVMLPHHSSSQDVNQNLYCRMSPTQTIVTNQLPTAMATTRHTHTHVTTWCLL